MSIDRFRKILVMCVLAGTLVSAGCRVNEYTPEEYFVKAQKLFRKGEITGAILELKNALRKDPQMVQARWLLGRIYLQQGLGAYAEKEIRKAMKFGLSSDAAAISLARALLLQGKYEEVARFDAGGNQEETGRSQLLALKGNAFLMLGQPETAERHFLDALSLDDSNPEARTGIALLDLSRNRIPQAKSQLGAVLETNPDFAAAWEVLGWVEQQDGRLEAAEQAYTKAMRDPIHRDGSQQKRAMVRVAMGKLDQAAEDALALKRRHPGNPYIEYVYGYVEFHRKHYDKARESFENVLSSLPDNTAALFYMGATSYISGDLESANTYLTQHLARNPGNLVARKMLAQVELLSRNPEAATKTAMEILRQEPGDVELMNLLAEAMSDLGKQDTALAYLKKMVASQPDSVSVRVRLGQALVQEGQTEEGISELEKAIELAPKSPLPVESLVRQQLRSGNLDGALKAARGYRDRQPDSVPAYMLLGSVYLARKEMDAAAKAFERARALAPDNVLPYNGLAVIAIGKKDYAGAESLYREALKRAPNHLQLLTNLAKLKLMRGEDADARLVLEKDIKHHPHELEPVLLLGRNYLKAGKPGPALQLVRQALPSHPLDKNLLGLKADAELAAGRYAEAKSTLTRLSRLVQDDPRVHYALARVYEGLHEPEMKRKSLKKAVGLNPDFLPAQLALARLALREGNITEAERRITSIKERIGENIPSLLLLEGQMDEVRGDWSKASKAYDKLFALQSDSRNLRRLVHALWWAGDKEAAMLKLDDWLASHRDDVVATLDLAQRSIAMGRNRKAIALYRKVLKIDPKNALALNNLAMLLRESDPKVALEYAKQAYELYPEDPSVLDTLAGAWLSFGDPGRAARMNERSLEIKPDNPSFLFRRAQILGAEGRNDEAIDALNRALRSGRDFPEKSMAKNLLARLKSGA